MKVSLIGFYGHNNPGDDRILFCLKRLLHGHDIFVINGFAGLREHWETVNSCDYVIFGGGGLVQRGTGIHAGLFEDLRPPLFCLGISVEAVHSDNADLRKVLNEKSRFILVRDEKSAQAFGQSGKVVVGPDLTFLFPYEIADCCDAASDVCGLNLLSWHFWHFEYKSFADKLLRRCAKRFPHFETFYPLRKWKPALLVEAVRQRFNTVLPLPFYSEPGHVSDKEVLSRFFERFHSDTFSPESMGRCGVVVAMRLHASIFSCQMGIPFVSLAYQPKNSQFCESIGHGAYCMNLFQPSRFGEGIESLRRNQREIRKSLLAASHDCHLGIRRLVEGLLQPLI
ncbi:MAG TPA: polysaccharide pyruvyl transferase family protein [Clostridia bacterium]|nr:polysaccharide pyruvyl transferase family protein [Clostridia bacterium]